MFHINILALGDICGENGLAMVERHLKPLRKLYHVDLCVVNGENAAVLGLTAKQSEQLFRAGADVITLGNHTYRRREIIKALEQSDYLIRPFNFAGGLPGQGYCMTYSPEGRKVCVVNLIGRCMMQDNSSENPFWAVERLLKQVDADLFVVDFHAEATSEKLAMGYHLDGRAAVVFGTHTHVPTADAQILPKGTGYLTDLGMCGPINSILGIKPTQALGSFLGALPERYDSAGGPCKLQGALFTITESTGQCTAVTRIDIAD